MHLLIVEDEQRLRENLRERLRSQGHVVEVAADGEEGLYYGEEYPLDLAVIDIGLPKMSGLELIRRFRAMEKHFPILVLTARRAWQDKVAGLETGADDYLVKPFRFEELQARMNALLRRASGWTKPVLECGPIALDTGKQTVSVAGEPVELTAFEYRVLEQLMLHAGQVVSKAELTDTIYRTGLRPQQQCAGSLHRTPQAQAGPGQQTPAHRNPARPRLPLQAGGMRGVLNS